MLALAGRVNHTITNSFSRLQTIFFQVFPILIQMLLGFLRDHCTSNYNSYTRCISQLVLLKDSNSFHFARKQLNTGYNLWSLLKLKSGFSLLWNKSIKVLSTVLHDILICQFRVAFGRCRQCKFSSSQSKDRLYLLYEQVQV